MSGTSVDRVHPPRLQWTERGDRESGTEFTENTHEVTPLVYWRRMAVSNVRECTLWTLVKTPVVANETRLPRIDEPKRIAHESC